jgi:hypothetical protein
MSYVDISKVVNEYLKIITPGERIKYIPPVESVWDLEFNDFNWDIIEELQMTYRGSLLPEDIFVTLRFDMCPENRELTVDIYRLP